MRLIDADNLLLMMEKRADCEPNHYRVIKRMMKLVCGEPTVKLVKHGHWVENPIGCSCSVCGEVHRYDVLTANMTHLYCNHCGSRMDEVSE